MQAGKNRKRDLKLLSEVYSSNLLGEGMKDYYAAQEQGTGSSGYQQARMAPNMGTETHTGYPAEAEDQNPVGLNLCNNTSTFLIVKIFFFHFSGIGLSLVNNALVPN